MLDESLLDPVDRQASGRRLLLLPISLLVHLVAIAALVVVPLLLADSTNLPQIQVTNVLIVVPSLPVPPPPPPPPFGRGGRSKVPAKAATEKKEVKPPVLFGKLIAPIEVPVTIEEDDSDFGVEGGVPWGVPGGVEGGVEGGVLGGVPGGVLGGEFSNEAPFFVSGKNVPKLIKEVKPEYPVEALAARVQSVVIVEAKTDIYGRVGSARIISGHPLFHEAALRAVRQWLYEPYIVDGVPRPIYFTVSITFGMMAQ